jgi:carboxylesterase
MTDILPGAEPFSAAGGPAGVLVLHGFTGNPQSMRPLAQALAAAGFTVELPLLPGHGTSIDDMLTTGWADWSGAAEAAYIDLAGRCSRVVVAGLSMGGTLTCWLASRHPEIAGIICVNPAVEPAADSFLEILDGMAATGAATMPAVGNDIAMPGTKELAYDATPIAGVKDMLLPSPPWNPSWGRSAARCCCSPARRTMWSPRPAATCWPPASPGRWSGCCASAATTWPPWITTGPRSTPGRWSSPPR